MKIKITDHAKARLVLREIYTKPKMDKLINFVYLVYCKGKHTYSDLSVKRKIVEFEGNKFVFVEQAKDVYVLVTVLEGWMKAQ